MSRKVFRILAAALLMAVALTSCKSEYEALLNSNDVDSKYKAAFDYFNHGKFNKAAQLFESLAILTNGTDRDDTVQYYWGMSNYRYKDYYTAETNFAKFLQNFPRSPFAEEAAFLRIDCLYRSTLRYELDQVPTYNAINVISQYMVENPRSTHYPICSRMLEELNNRLDKKAYENALLYYRMEDYKAARVAFKNILKDDAENVYREEISSRSSASSPSRRNVTLLSWTTITTSSERIRILLSSAKWMCCSAVPRKPLEDIPVRKRISEKRKRISSVKERNY